MLENHWQGKGILFHTGLTHKGNPTHPKAWEQVPVFRLLSGFDKGVVAEDRTYRKYIRRIKPCGPIQKDLLVGGSNGEAYCATCGFSYEEDSFNDNGEEEEFCYECERYSFI